MPIVLSSVNVHTETSGYEPIQAFNFTISLRVIGSSPNRESDANLCIELCSIVIIDEVDVSIYIIILLLYAIPINAEIYLFRKLNGTLIYFDSRMSKRNVKLSKSLSSILGHKALEFVFLK